MSTWIFFSGLIRQSSSIKAKVVFTFCILIIVTGITEFYAFLQVNKLNDGSLKEDFKILQAEVKNLKSTSYEFILKERNNLEFYKTGKSFYIDKYQQAYQSFNHTAERTQQSLDSSDYGQNEELQKLKLSVKEYNLIFGQLKDKIHERGFEQYGIIGEFDKSLKEISQFNFGSDNEGLLQLKLFIKEYQLTGNPEIIKKATYETYQFSRILEKHISNDQVDHVLNALSNYEKSLARLIEIDTTLGFYSGQGLQKALFDQMSVIENDVNLKNTQQRITDTYNEILGSIFTSLLIILLSTLALAITISWVLYKGIIKPIESLKNLIMRMGEGDIPEIPIYQTLVLDQMGQSVRKLAQRLKNTSVFAESIGNGNFDAPFVAVNEKDILGNALIAMRNNLHKVSKEEEERKWTNEGYTIFIDILRNHVNSPEELGSKLLASLIKYLKFNQGGLFILDDDNTDDIHMELIACYAWGKKKFQGKKIKLGEGLVGQAWIEKEKIYLTDIPDNYVKITSGLGKANPNTILIIPLKFNEQIYGVFELASFTSIELYKIAFLEKVAESTAASIANIKINQQTKKLLQQTQQQSLMMKSQEEVMRQNMEEIQATSEEMFRKEQEYLQKIATLEKKIAIMKNENIYSKSEDRVEF